MPSQLHSALWAIRPEALAAVAAMLQAQAAGEQLAGTPQLATTRSEVTIIPVHGTLTDDGPANFGSNYQAIANAAEKAGADPSVSRIVLSVNSPGGAVIGLPECAAVIAQVAKVKPVSAIVEGQSASAAYWLASQASDITLTPSGEVGSVGVRMMHVDASKMLSNSGFTVTELHSGDFKTEWSQYKPLSDEAKEDMQSRLNATHDEFVRAVSRGRGARASSQMVRSRFGEGRMIPATAALAHGLVDKLQSARDFYQSLTATTEATAPHGLSFRRARVALERARV